MKVPASASPWQPLTFGGVAAFAAGPGGRLARVWFVAALGCSACVLWFAVACIIPVADQAVAALPPQGQIRGGRLEWPQAVPSLLAANPVLAVGVDPVAYRAAGSAADLELVLCPNELRVGGLLGSVRLGYPRSYLVMLGRPNVDAWWQAWQPAILAALGVAAFLGLLLTWAGLATLYAFPVRALAGGAHRDLSLGGAWRLSAAALVPGALLVSVALVLYGLHRLPLPGLLLAWLVHVPVGWLYAGFSICWLPRRALPQGNPFRHGDDAKAGAARKTNPFARGGT